MIILRIREIRPVSLEGNIKRKIVLPARRRLLVQLHNMREQHAVVAHRLAAVQCLISILIEIVILEAQPPVDRAAVIEPVIIRMAALYGVSLLAEIPRIGIGRSAETWEFRQTGQELPFRDNRAAAECIAQRRSAVRFLLQLMPELIGVLGKGQLIKARKIRIGFQHTGDHIDLFALRDVRIVVLGERPLSCRNVLSGHIGIYNIRNTVQERIDEPMILKTVTRIMVALKAQLMIGSIIDFIRQIDVFISGKGNNQQRYRHDPTCKRLSGMIS